MPKAASKTVSTAPFPFVRQFTAPPFFVDIEDAKLKSKLLLDAVQHAGPTAQPKKPTKRKPIAKNAAPASTPKKRGKAAGKG